VPRIDLLFVDEHVVVALLDRLGLPRESNTEIGATQEATG
jgi:hypothetical protein